MWDDFFKILLYDFQHVNIDNYSAGSVNIDSPALQNDSTLPGSILKVVI